MCMICIELKFMDIQTYTSTYIFKKHPKYEFNDLFNEKIAKRYL